MAVLKILLKVNNQSWKCWTFFCSQIHFLRFKFIFTIKSSNKYSLVFRTKLREPQFEGWKSRSLCLEEPWWLQEAQRSSFFQIYFPMNRTRLIELLSRLRQAPHFSPFFLFKDSNLSLKNCYIVMSRNQIRMLYFEKKLTLFHESILRITI